jgi:hypothetical protein
MANSFKPVQGAAQVFRLFSGAGVFNEPIDRAKQTQPADIARTCQTRQEQLFPTIPDQIPLRAAD